MSDFDERAQNAADAVRQKMSNVDVDPTTAVKRARKSTTNARLSTVAFGVVAVMLITSVGVRNSSRGPDRIALGDGEHGFELASALRPFSACDDLLSYFKQHAPDALGSPNVVFNGTRTAGAAAEDMAAVAESATPTHGSATASPPSFSQTNVVEAGVDEPDIVKTDGRRIVTVVSGQVQLLGLVDGTPELEGRLGDGYAQRVLLNGDRLLILESPRSSFDSANPTAGTVQRSRVFLYDIASMSSPHLISELEVDGSVVDARLVGGQVRLVTLSQPKLDVPYPRYDNNGKAVESPEALIRAAAEKSTLDDWVPLYTQKNGRGDKVAEGQLVECSNLAVPKNFSGLTSLAVTTFDMSSEMNVKDSVGVIAGGQTVYATARHLYVSTTDFQLSGNSPTETQIHKFETASEGVTSYRASGTVPGTLLNEYSMSDYRDVLRIATTVVNPGGMFRGATTYGLVTTLAEDGSVLVKRGEVGGLGAQDNESIRSVRFIGDKGYVVTFRQTDPLYVIDLTDPAKPRNVGQLKIPGYSGYLHPVGENRLLGVGQAGVNGAQTTPLDDCDSCDAASKIAPPVVNGVQFSLFDVSDPAAPRRLATKTYDQGQAVAEYDAKGFLFWAPRSLVVAPMQTYGRTTMSSGAVLIEVKASELQEIGRVDDEGSTIVRSLVIGDDLYTLSDRSLLQTKLDGMKRGAQVELAPTNVDLDRPSVDSKTGTSPGSTGTAPSTGSGASGSPGAAPAPNASDTPVASK